MVCIRIYLCFILFIYCLVLTKVYLNYITVDDTVYMIDGPLKITI